MEDDMQRLEDLVERAADRVRRLSNELQAARARIDELERQAGTAMPDPRSEQAWRAERSQVVLALRETLSELRSG